MVVQVGKGTGAAQEVVASPVAGGHFPGVKHQAAPGHVVPQPEPLDQEDGLEVSVAHALPD